MDFTKYMNGTNVIEMEANLVDLKKEVVNAVELEDIGNATLAIKTLKAKIEMAKEVEAKEDEEIVDKINKGELKDMGIKEVKDTVEHGFVNALRDKGVSETYKNAMSEGVLSDGGYTVPQDIRTRINELKEAKGALSTLVNVEPVSTETGSRVYQTRATQTGFSLVAEAGKIGDKATPTFKTISYKVDKYAGILKTSNELLKDSDQAITRTLTRWIGNDSRVTRNNLIIAELNKKAKTAFTDFDTIKHAVNVDLDPAFRATSKIIVNQDSFDFLDQLKDTQGRYLMQDSVTSVTGKKILGLDVIMMSNKDLPSDTTSGKKAPVIIGDLKEYCALFDREALSIRVSDIAGDAFTDDLTLFRCIERLQAKVIDDEAIVFGQVTIS